MVSYSSTVYAEKHSKYFKKYSKNHSIFEQLECILFINSVIDTIEL